VRGIRLAATATTPQFFVPEFRDVAVAKLYSNHWIFRITLPTAAFILKIFNCPDAAPIPGVKSLVLTADNLDRRADLKGSTGDIIEN
jgi:hypothetical protein